MQIKYSGGREWNSKWQWKDHSGHEQALYEYNYTAEP